VGELLSFSAMISICIGGLLVAVVGFCDDLRDVRASSRLAVHFAAAGIALAAMGGLAPIPALGDSWSLGSIGYLVGALFIVWMLNLYNFMDGIDGIAGTEAVTACTGAAFILWSMQEPGYLWAWPLVLACAAAGFLVWNFPPAKIFMGDAGSGFLGFSMAVLAIWSAWIVPAMVWAWIILLGVFVADATTTLFRRLLRGERAYEAHRSHAYQYAARRTGRHLPVTLGVAAINIFWLVPWAWCAATSRMDGVLATGIAYLPLVILAFVFNAGQSEAVERQEL
jgi:Fuc2NAc and GlcNAc transferase